MRLAHAKGIPMCYGSDLLGELHQHQLGEFALRARVLPPQVRPGGLGGEHGEGALACMRGQGRVQVHACCWQGAIPALAAARVCSRAVAAAC